MPYVEYDAASKSASLHAKSTSYVPFPSEHVDVPFFIRHNPPPLPNALYVSVTFGVCCAYANIASEYTLAGNVAPTPTRATFAPRTMLTNVTYTATARHPPRALERRARARFRCLARALNGASRVSQSDRATTAIARDDASIKRASRAAIASAARRPLSPAAFDARRQLSRN